MVNPFDLRNALLARHAQHVVLIHFPIALFISGVAFDLLSRGKRASHWASAAYLNLTAAAIFIFPTVATGVLAWQLALDGKKLKGILLMHVVMAAATTFLVLVTWFVHWRTRKSEPALLPAYRIPIELLGVVLIALTAHLGGFLSGVNL